MHKIYGLLNGGSGDWLEAIALGDDGFVVGSHICSSEDWMPHDLGMDGQSNWKHENYNKQYGEGNWETEFVPNSKIDTHEGLQAALKAARERMEKDESITKCKPAGVTLVVVDEEGKETEHHKSAF